MKIWEKFKFLAALILHETKNSGGSIILSFELWWRHVKTENMPPTAPRPSAKPFLWKWVIRHERFFLVLRIFFVRYFLPSKSVCRIFYSEVSHTSYPPQMPNALPFNNLLLFWSSPCGRHVAKIPLPDPPCRTHSPYEQLLLGVIGA